MTQGVILTIDATDPCGGSGVNVATKVAAALGGYAQAVVTAVSVQTPNDMLGIYPVPQAVVVDQIRAALTSYPVGAVLIGLLPTKDIVDGVADVLENLSPRPPIIVDPILASREGKKFLDKSAIDALKRRILVISDLLLPNIGEAEGLTGLSIHDEAALEHAAEMLLTLGPRNVFLKGETLSTDKIIEIYADDRRTQVFNSDRIGTKRLHGAGATLAAAVATLVAQGNTPREGVTKARSYLETVIKNAPGMDDPTIPTGHFVA